MSNDPKTYAEMANELIAGKLDPAGFSHRAHVAVAYEILTRHEVFEALALFAGGLQKLTEAAGVPEKFNATVTFAFISLIAARMEEQKYVDSEAFLTRNPDLLGKAVLAPYFGSEELVSNLARKVPLMPGMAKLKPVAA
ncbi:hypothetical protein [Primorskyibacter sp. S87]|uniref:hypothetical protein n=1 Tax=Primorskyibacter sp. S87 TaxID=3415126 RepID=UPI003C7D0B0D